MGLTDFVVTVVTSGLVSGAVSAAIAGRFQLRADRLNRRNDHWVEARSALADVEVAYVEVRNGDRDEGDLLEVEATFTNKVDVCAHVPLTEAADALRETGRLYASHDPDNGQGPFEEGIEAVRKVIQERLSGLN